MKHIYKIVFLLIFCSLLYFTQTFASQLPNQWTGNLNNDMNNVANWGAGLPSPGDDLEFGDLSEGASNYSPNNNLGNPFIVGNITVDTTNSYEFTGNPFEITSNQTLTINASFVPLFSCAFILDNSTLEINNIPDSINGGASLEGGIQDGVDGPGGITLTNLQTTTFGSSCSYSGPTLINDGTLQVFGNALSPQSAVTLGTGASPTLILAFADNTILSLSGGTALNSSVILQNASLTLGDSLSHSYAGFTTGTGGITKQGTGNLNLNGASDYSGTTTISAGNIIAGSTIALSPNSLFTLDDSAAVVLDLAGFNNTIGGLSGGTTAGQVHLNGASLVIAMNGGDQTFSGIISDSGSPGSITKNGSSTLTLSNTNTYSGSTTLMGGTLAIAMDSNLGTSNMVVGSGGTLQTTTGFSSNLQFSLTSATTTSIDTSGSSNTTTLTQLISGNGALQKIGLGTLILSQSNSYGGGTVIKEGTLQISTAGNIGGPSASLTLSGGTLHSTGNVSSTGLVTVTASSTINTDVSTSTTFSGTLLGSDATTLTIAGSGTTSLATTQVNSSDTFTIAGPIGGAQLLTKTGPGTLVLSGTNTYTAGTALGNGILSISADANLGNNTGSVTGSGGTLQTTASLSSNRLFSLNTMTTTPIDIEGGSNTTTLSNTISSGGALQKIGAGTLVLSGTNSYSGGTTLSVGTLQIASAANLGGASLNLTLAGGTLHATGNVTTSGPVAVTNNSAINTDTAMTSTFSGTLTGSDATTLTLAGPGTNSFANISVGSTNTFTIAGPIGGTQVLTKIGTGTLVLAGTNTYTGGTTLGNGILSISADNNLGNSTGSVTGSGGTLQTTASLSSNRLFSLNTMTTTPIDIEGGSNTTTLSNTISSGGALQKIGAGTLVLSGTNSYSGGTTLSVGTLQIASAANLGGASLNLTLAGGTLHATGNVTTSGPVAVTNNSAINTSTAMTSTFSGTLTGSDATTLTLAGPGTNSFANVSVGSTDTFTIAGPIGGSQVLTKIGTGTLVLAGTNTYTAGTSINAGTLSIAAGSNIGGNTAGFTLAGGTLHTTGTMTTSGAVGVTDNSLINTDVSTILSGILTGSNGKTLTLSGSGSTSLGSIAVTNLSDVFTITGIISGTQGLQKNGNGTLVLSSANTYTNGTTLNAGVLSISSDSNLGNASGAITGAGGTLQVTSGFTSNRSLALTTSTTTSIDTAGNTLAFAGTISGSGTLQKIGAGSLVLTNTNTSGPTNVTAGTLLVNGSGQLTSTPVTVSSGARLGGSGTYVGNMINNGTLAPGASIGTTHLTGNYTQATGSTLEIEFSPTSADLLDITGSATIQSGATLALLPSPGTYPAGTSFTILEATGGIGSEPFSNITISVPSLMYSLVYSTDTLMLIIHGASVLLLPTNLGGNAGAVANALNTIAPSPDTDLGQVYDVLLSLSGSALKNALDQMQPSLYKGLIEIAQENSWMVRDSFTSHTQQLYPRLCSSNLCSCPAEEIPVQEEEPSQSFWEKLNPWKKKAANYKKPCPKKWQVWIDLIGDFIHQGKLNDIGFHASSGAAVLGVDYQPRNYLLMGVGGAYSYSTAHWEQGRGTGKIQSGYGVLYGSYFTDCFFVNTTFVGSYNHYLGHRHVEFSTIDRTAIQSHGGYTLLGHVDTGWMFKRKKFEYRPFGSCDYTYLQEGNFKEHGAQSIDLNVKASNAQMLRPELGVNWSYCHRLECSRWVYNVKCSWVKEIRLCGQRYQCTFVDTDVPFTVSGVKPNRSLFSPGAFIEGFFLSDQLSMSLRYSAELGRKFNQQLGSLQIAYQF